ncbi:MAG: acyl--CoA ligase [Sphingobacteriia bacterium]|nr:acyl--CoA ligase [Sphingobacteriia bacterium]
MSFKRYGKVYLNEQLYPFFQQEVQHQIYKLKSLGVNDKEVIGLNFKSNLEFLKVYLACRELNLIPLIIYKTLEAKEEAKKFGASLLIKETENKLEYIKISSKKFLNNKELNNVAVICRSSGTTGMPKLIAWNHNGINFQSTATFNHLNYLTDDKLLISLPLWCAYGLSILHMWEKYKMDLILADTLNPKHLCEIINITKSSAYDSTPVFYSFLYNFLVKNPNYVSKISSIRIWGCGGDILPLKLAKLWYNLTGKPILDGYGQVEAGPNISINTLENFRFGSVGKCLKNIQTWVEKDGELVVESPSIMEGYWVFENGDYTFNIADKTLYTGDIVNIDEEGYIKIIGRKKNIIIVNGYNINPETIEQTLLNHKNIEEVGVTYIDMNDLGHKKLTALVKLNSKDTNIIEDIKKWSLEKLHQELFPKYYFIIESLPYHSNGKIDRIALKNLASQCYSSTQENLISY